MKQVVAMLAGISLLATTGCSTIRNELRYPGGASGAILDKRTFDASQSKQLALLRAALALAIAARIGEGSVATEDADAFARQLAEASNEINYAAVDAGFPVLLADDEGVGVPRKGRTCTIAKGKARMASFADDVQATVLHDLNNKTYAEADAECAGYFVNFEANIARIESRIVRAMLTSLPTERARKFLENLAQGKLLSALWSLGGAAGDITGAFHRGAGVYRAGLENVAATTPECAFDPAFRRKIAPKKYFQDRDTVLIAAACLGLSPDSLFDNEAIEPGNLPNQLDPHAFLALFRIVRTSCVALPLINPSSADAEKTFQESRKAREDSCKKAVFNPKPRPDEASLPPDP